MTDEQRRNFRENLTKFFETIEQELNGQTVENTKKIDKWAINTYNRYTYLKRNDESKKKNWLALESLEMLVQGLKEKNITEEEYIDAKGKRQNIKELLKQKEQSNIEIIEVYTYEEIEKKREELYTKLNKLKSQHTERYRRMYNLSEEKYNKIGEEITKTKQEIKQITEELQQKPEKKQENTENHSEIIKKLTNENNTNQEVIKSLKDQIDRCKKENVAIAEAYSKKNEEELKTAKEYNKELELRIKQQRHDLDEKDKTIEKLNNEIQKNTKLEKQIKERQQQIIVKLLCSSSDVSLEKIKNYLEKEKIPTEGLEESLKELRTMIPGMTRVLKDESDTHTFTLRTDALDKLKQYKNDIVCPKISDIENGTIKFLVRSDMHLNMNSSLETVKRLLSPYMEYSIKEGNIPIIDIGDIADTRRPYTIDDWEKLNKEAIKYAYNIYKNYAKTINTAQEIKHYTLFGNHDAHPYIAGIDPLEIIYEYSDNFNILGISKGQFKIAEDKIQVLHDKPWGNIVPFKEEHDKEIRNKRIYEYIKNNINQIIGDYVYTLIGHYHFGTINPQERFAVLNNGIENTLLFTVEIENKNIKRIYINELYQSNNTVKKSGYQTEIYDRQKILKK